MARPWQIDIAVSCPHCIRRMDLTVELGRASSAADATATCPHCNKTFIQDPSPGIIISVGKRE